MCILLRKDRPVSGRCLPCPVRAVDCSASPALSRSAGCCSACWRSRARPRPITSAYLCTGYVGCENAGYPSAGYAANNDRMYWRMYSGHNCTNYVAYRMVKAGMSTERPWSGSGNGHNWGVRDAQITDEQPDGRRGRVVDAPTSRRRLRRPRRVRRTGDLRRPRSSSPRTAGAATSTGARSSRATGWPTRLHPLRRQGDRQHQEADGTRHAAGRRPAHRDAGRVEARRRRQVPVARQRRADRRRDRGDVRPGAPTSAAARSRTGRPRARRASRRAASPCRPRLRSPAAS